MQLNRKLHILPDIAGVFCLMVFAGLLCFGGQGALSDADSLWHIKMGETMLERGAVLTQDIFSHTAYGMPWTAHEWLAEVIMAALHQVGGLPLVVIFFFLLVAFTFWLLFKIANTFAGEWVSFFCVIIALFFSGGHLLARPHLFTWLFGVVTLYILLKGGRRLYILPPLTALWANLHGGVVLGLLLQGTFIAGHILERWSLAELLRNWKPAIREYKEILLVLLLSILAVGINPFGYQLFAFQFHATQAVFSTSILEWKAPDLQRLWPFRIYILLIISILFSQKTKTTWTDRLLLLFFINAALTHVRHVNLAVIFLTPFLARSLNSWSQQLIRFKHSSSGQKDLLLSSTSGPIATVTLFAILVAASASGIPGWQKAADTLFDLPEKFSKNAALYIEQNPPKGNMFNEYSLGGYLIYALDPPPAVFIDGRADMYGEKVFKDYVRITNLEEESDELLAEYNIDWVIFPTARLLTRYLMAEGSWEEVYRDDQTSILVRKSLSSENTPKVSIAEAPLSGDCN